MARIMMGIAGAINVCSLCGPLQRCSPLNAKLHAVKKGIRRTGDRGGDLKMAASGKVQVPKSILIVDDDVEVAETCARVLKASGFRCAVVFDLTSALSLFDMLRPALVLSDINLPLGDGYEVVRHVQKAAPGTPVILMTGFDAPLVHERAIQAGAAAYLRKPFSNSELISNVRELIARDGNS